MIPPKESSQLLTLQLHARDAERAINAYIDSLWTAGYSQADIADALGVVPHAISGRIKRYRIAEADRIYAAQNGGTSV